MSSGIAEAGRRWAQRDRPTPLPVQALDHATGYYAAAAALAGLRTRLGMGAGSRWRASLARTASLLLSHPSPDDGSAPEPLLPDPLSAVEHTSWGSVQRLRPPVLVDGAPLRWSLPARALGGDEAAWK